MSSLIVLREWPVRDDIVTIKTREDAVRYGCVGLYETLVRDDAKRGPRPEFMPVAEVKP